MQNKKIDFLIVPPLHQPEVLSALKLAFIGVMTQESTSQHKCAYTFSHLVSVLVFLSQKSIETLL